MKKNKIIALILTSLVLCSCGAMNDTSVSDDSDVAEVNSDNTSFSEEVTEASETTSETTTTAETTTVTTTAETTAASSSYVTIPGANVGHISSGIHLNHNSSSPNNIPVLSHSNLSSGHIAAETTFAETTTATETTAEAVTTVQIEDQLQFNEYGNYIVDDRGDGNCYLWFGDKEWENFDNMSMSLYCDDGEGLIDLGSTFYCYEEVTRDDGAKGIRLDFDGYWYAIDGKLMLSAYMDCSDDGSYYTDDSGRVETLVYCELNGSGENEYFAVYLDGDKDAVFKPVSYLKKNDNDEYEAYAFDGASLDARLTCDFYNYDGSYDDWYYISDPFTLSEKTNISLQHFPGSYQFFFSIYDKDGNYINTEWLYRDID